MEHSLHGAALMVLNMADASDKLPQPWDMVVQRPHQPDRRLPPGTTIDQVFDESSPTLLILGEPGSGKTTTLLSLAQARIALAKKDATAPIPVVFALSTWAKECKPLDEWLVTEFKDHYDVPPAQAKQWIQDGSLLLMLDGFDEVAAPYRTACVIEIDNFLKHRSQALVITCRIQEYEELDKSINLDGAVRLLPLDRSQVDRYLGQGGKDLDALRQAVHQDTVLAVLAATPLWLNLMIVVYRGVPYAQLSQGLTEEIQKEQLFNRYIARMLHDHPRSHTQRYSNHTHTLHRLRWLARNMVQDGIRLFSFHHLQPSWLNGKISDRRWYWLNALVAGLIGAAIFGLALWLLTRTVDGFIYGLVFGQVIGMIGAQIGAINAKSLSFPTTIKWSLANIYRASSVALGLDIALLIGLLTGLGAGFSSTPLKGLGVGLINALIVWLGVWLSNAIRTEFTEIESTITQSPNLYRNRALRNGMIIGLVVGLTVALVVGLIGGLINGLINGLTNGLLYGLVYGLTSALVYGLIGGLSVALVFGLVFGIASVIQHTFLRLLLIREGTIPWNYQRFLNYACDRVLMYRSGIGYVFVHRLLMEHIANLSDEDIEAIAENRV
jgi:hypothetical protein